MHGHVSLITCYYVLRWITNNITCIYTIIVDTEIKLCIRSNDFVVSKVNNFQFAEIIFLDCCFLMIFLNFSFPIETGSDISRTFQLGIIKSCVWVNIDKTFINYEKSFHDWFQLEFFRLFALIKHFFVANAMQPVFK